MFQRKQRSWWVSDPSHPPAKHLWRQVSQPPRELRVGRGTDSHFGGQRCGPGEGCQPHEALLAGFQTGQWTPALPSRSRLGWGGRAQGRPVHQQNLQREGEPASPWLSKDVVENGEREVLWKRRCSPGRGTLWLQLNEQNVCFMLEVPVENGNVGSRDMTTAVTGFITALTM